MRKPNMPLIIGCVIILMLLTIMLFPQLFTNKSPYNTRKMIMSYDEAGELTVERAPFAPSGAYLLGSDDMGRDILSYILYGTKLTIILAVFIALGRFLLAIPLALTGGLGSRAIKNIIKIFGVLFSAVPAVLVGMIILQMDYFTGLDRTGSTIAFIAVLSFVGWPKLGSLIMERVEAINSMPFIRAEVAIGKRRSRIALENVIPHLAPELLVLYFMEIARALTMIMTLGVFNVFIGNLKFVASTDFGVYVFYNVSFEPEWASMLSTSRGMLGVAPWAVIFPALAFFISVLGFNLVGEGLKTLMQKRDFKVIPMMRKFITLDFASLWRESASASKVRMTVIAVFVPILLFIPGIIDKAVYKMEPGTKDIFYHQVMLGTESSEKTAELIAERMSGLGIEPLKDDSYLLSYELEPSNILLEHSFRLENGAAAAPVINEDYAFIEAGSFEKEGLIFNSTREDLFNIEDYSKYDGTFVLIDKSLYNDQALAYILENISSRADIKGILLIARHGETVENLFIKENKERFVLLVSRDFSQELLGTGDPVLTVSAVISPIERTGRNLIGIKRPAEDTLDGEALMIGMNYNYLTESGAEVLQFNLDFMERLCTYQNKRSIIFLFLDGTISDQYNGVHSITDSLPYTAYKIEAYIDLTGLEAPEFDQIVYSDLQAPYIRQYAWSIGHQLKKHFNSSKIGMEEIEAVLVEGEYSFTQSTAFNAMFWNKGIGTIIIGTREAGEKKHDIYDIGSILLEVINKNSY